MYSCTNMTSEQVDDLWQRLGDQLELLVSINENLS